MRRALVTAGIGLLVVLLLLPWMTWGLAVVIGWDAASLVFLASLWPIIVCADGSQVQRLATLRYAHLYYRSPARGIVFDNAEGPERATYRDFAYIAFTIGMCYQVSDTNVRNPRIRGTVLWHALLSYLFGVVIIGGSVNLIAGLVR